MFTRWPSRFSVGVLLAALLLSSATALRSQADGQRSSPPLNKGGQGGVKPGNRRPTTRPAATQPAIPAFEPLSDATEGEWAVYRATDDRELRYDLTHAGGGIIQTRVTVRQAGKLLGQPTIREDLRDTDPLARQARTTHAQRSMTRTRLKLAGRNWDAQLYEDRWIDEGIHYIRRTWVSNDAPVFGLLRMELKGNDRLEARFELSSFGRPTGSLPSS